MNTSTDASDPTSTIQYTSVYCGEIDGKPLFNEEGAIIELLAAGVLFMSGGYQSPSDTIELAVNCNDLFWWGTADSEHCLPNELQGLYDRWKADPQWGASVWCCLHRNLQPQKPVREKMQNAKAWTAQLAALLAPSPS